MNPYFVEENRHSVLNSQLHTSVWINELKFENDEYLRFHINEGVLNGFRIVDVESDIEPYIEHNYRSCLNRDVYPIVDQTIRNELNIGKYVIVNDQPKCMHALGAINQKGKNRIITNCSRPCLVKIAISKFNFVYRRGVSLYKEGRSMNLWVYYVCLGT